MTIPYSVRYFGYGALSGCSRLTDIKGDSTHPWFSSKDGVLFNKDKTILLQFPGGRNGHYTIPESITSISGGAFRRCTNPKSVTIPDGITNIGRGAFWGCSNLTSVTIPASVTYIGKWAFESCGELERIVFEGDAPLTDGDGNETCRRGIFSGVAETAKTFIKPDAKGFSFKFRRDPLGRGVEVLPKEIEISIFSTGVAPFSFTF